MTRMATLVARLGSLFATARAATTPLLWLVPAKKTLVLAGITGLTSVALYFSASFFWTELKTSIEDAAVARVQASAESAARKKVEGEMKELRAKAERLESLRSGAESRAAEASASLAETKAQLEAAQNGAGASPAKPAETLPATGAAAAPQTPKAKAKGKSCRCDVPADRVRILNGDPPVAKQRGRTS
jgi:hypothetical protein